MQALRQFKHHVTKRANNAVHTKYTHDSDLLTASGNYFYLFLPPKHALSYILRSFSIR